MLNVINLVLGAALLFAGRKLFWLFIGVAGFVTGVQLATRFWQGSELLAIVVGLILGVIARLSARYFTEQQVHGYLGVVASLIILGIGLWLLKSRWAALRDPSAVHHHRHLFHSHDHGVHSHDHHPHTHGENGHGHSHNHDDDHPHPHPHPEAGERTVKPLGPAGLVLLGISGGIVPCPAALAILLASASVGDLGKGLALVIVFSLGLALSLVTIGLAVVNGVRATSRFIDTERYAPKIAFLSAVVVTLVGAVTLYSSLSHFGAA